jgi:hypothetical protein
VLGVKLNVAAGFVEVVLVADVSEEQVALDPLCQVVVIVFPDPDVHVVVATSVAAVCPTSYVYVVVLDGVVIATVGSACTVTVSPLFDGVTGPPPSLSVSESETTTNPVCEFCDVEQA